MPTGLLFGPDFQAGPNRLDLPPKFKKTKGKTKKKVKSRSKGEPRSKVQRERKREEKKNRREEKLQRRQERREEEKSRRAEQGETEVRKAKRSVRKQNLCSERVDATIIKVLGRAQKRTVPKRKEKKVQKEVAGPIWRHGMREERHEHCQNVKIEGRRTKTVRKEQPDEKEKQSKLPPIVDVGPDQVLCSSGVGAAVLASPLEPMPPCMEFYQVRRQ